jgi:hypothetical protein
LSKISLKIFLKNETMESPQNKRFYFEVWSSSLWPTYIRERRTTFHKVYGIKVRGYGEHVGEHIGNLENILGTR